jgi:P4 family phage/plasmid primase-like protien
MDNFEDFLRKHSTNEKSKITHTRIGNIKKNIFAGSFCIEDNDINMFYKLYNHKVFVKGKEDYFTEKQLQDGKSPILIDFDFRYPENIKNRQHNEDHINDLLDLYMEKIILLINIDTDVNIPIYVLEKDDVNIVDNKGKKITKDGIHMIIGISMDHTLQCMLRQLVLEELDCIFGDLPLTNNYESVLDDGISKGHTNWQLYGSNKPDNKAYKIKYIYNVVLNSDNNFEINKKDLNDFNNLELLKKMSARNNSNSIYLIKDEVKDSYEKMKQKKIKKKIKKPNSLKNNKTFYSFDVSKLRNKDKLEEELDNFFSTLSIENNNLIETHKYLMCLPDKYCDDFNLWIRCGWALHNCNHNMFLSWMLFSARSIKFNYDDIEGYYDEWCNMNEDGLTERSIMYWAKQTNPKEYDNIRKETIDFYMEKSGKNESDIALVLYQMYKDEYRCASIKHKIWYRFMNHRWVEIDCGTTLRYNISRVLARLYFDKSVEIKSLAILNEDDEDNDVAINNLRKLGKKYSEIACILKATSVKQNIMKEAAEVFYDADPEFEKKLDANPELLCFSNGVYDFKNKCFRQGQPDDYITISTNIPYIEYNSSNPNHIKIKDEIELFMEQLFPDESLRRYMWEHLASCLIGLNKNQTINIYNGCGRNGKSALTDLIKEVLGDYFGNLSAAIITSKRAGIGGLSPELVKIKGCRYVVMSEPSKDDTINDGYMKQLTGGDFIEARALHRDPITYKPFFKLIVCTNNLFEIKSNDDGTWRRIRICEFESKFVKQPNPTPESPYEFLMNEDLPKKFDSWKSILASLLVNIYKQTNGIVNDCPRVIRASNNYRNDQDYFMQFFTDNITKGTADSIIKKTAIYNIFKAWYVENFGKNIPKGAELYKYISKKIGPYKNGWKGYKIVYDDNDQDEPLEQVDI